MSSRCSTIKSLSPSRFHHFDPTCWKPPPKKKKTAPAHTTFRTPRDLPGVLFFLCAPWCVKQLNRGRICNDCPQNDRIWISLKDESDKMKRLYGRTSSQKNDTFISWYAWYCMKSQDSSSTDRNPRKSKCILHTSLGKNGVSSIQRTFAFKHWDYVVDNKWNLQLKRIRFRIIQVDPSFKQAIVAK